MNQVLLPAKLEVQGGNPVSTVTLSLLEPETQVKPPLSPPTQHYAYLLLSLSSIPRPLLLPGALLRLPFFSQDGPSSWTFSSSSISGVR